MVRIIEIMLASCCAQEVFAAAVGYEIPGHKPVFSHSLTYWVE